MRGISNFHLPLLFCTVTLIAGSVLLVHAYSVTPPAGPTATRDRSDRLAQVSGKPQIQGQIQGNVQRSVVITVDDLPGAEPGTDHAIGNLKELETINRAIPSILRAHHVPAIGFVNEWKLQVSGERDARSDLLKRWLDAGLTLGNHTYTHLNFQTTPLAQYEDEVIRDEVVTSSLMAQSGQTEKYFRHPFLSTGPSAEVKAVFEAFLAERGYVVAPVTIDPSDYMFNDILGDALATKDRELGERAKKEYLAYVDTVFDFNEQASRKLFAREIPQILLVHDSNLNAKCLDAFLEKLEKRGYKFVSLDEALADPAYRTRDLYVGPLGIDWLTRWRLAFGLPLDYESTPEPPKWVTQKFDEIRRAHSGKLNVRHEGSLKRHRAADYADRGSW
jgi:peptidoglycan/xylan/chitin deacetylase (PgdA/CDA1 family)